MFEELLIVSVMCVALTTILFNRSKQTLAHRIQVIRVKRRPRHELFGNPATPDVDDEDEDEHAKRDVDPVNVDLFQTHNPELYAALARLRDLIVRDFVEWWYLRSISKSSSFVVEVKKAIDYVLVNLCMRISLIDWRSFLMQESVVLFTNLLRYIRLTEESLEKDVHNWAKFNELQKIQRLILEIDSQYNLHPGVKDQSMFLRTISAVLLKSIARKSDYSCTALKHLLREVLAFNVSREDSSVDFYRFLPPLWDLSRPCGSIEVSPCSLGPFSDEKNPRSTMIWTRMAILRATGPSEETTAAPIVAFRA